MLFSWAVLGEGSFLPPTVYGGYLSNRARKAKENTGKPIKAKGYYVRFLVLLVFPRFSRFPCYLGSPRTFFPLLAATGPPGPSDGPTIFVRGL